ncbi:MAG: dienelactone hydrolase family protein [Gammaproteobacteria bacterium]|nr:dienelactone hydrolase family protein [Gammaproteobacteria bacterium]
MKLVGIFAAVIGSVLTFSGAFAAVQSEPVSYQDGDIQLTGHIFWDDSIEGKRPGVLVVHEWWGLNDYAKGRAAMLAEMGYVAFALDMYGDDKVTTHPQQAQEWSSATTANLDAWRQRAMKGLEQLSANSLTDTNRLAAVGYCFGGATVMQLAYAGADLKGVVSFHGSLPLPNGDEAVKIKGKVLVEHGNDDAFMPPERVEAFKAAMGDAGIELTFHGHDGARHAFTNPDAGSFGIENLKYDTAADEASWKSMQMLFGEIF